MDIKELRLRAMYNPQSLTKAEWDMLCEEAFSVPKNICSEKEELKPRKKWW